MEPRLSVPCSKKPTGPYPEPLPSTHITNLFFTIIILLPISIFPDVFHLFVFPFGIFSSMTKVLKRSIYMRASVLSISSSLMWTAYWALAKSKNCDPFQYSVISSLLLLTFPPTSIFYSVFCAQTHSIYSDPLGWKLWVTFKVLLVISSMIPVRLIMFVLRKGLL